MFADQLRAAIEAAPRITLPQVTALLWRAYGDGQVSEAEAEALSGLIETRTLAAPRRGHNLTRRQDSTSPDPGSAKDVHTADTPQDRHSGPRRPGVGSRPRTGASMERRRRWAASGRLPPGLAARFTLAEQSVLSLVAAETARRGDCRLAVPHLAAVAGVAETTVRNAIREARKLGLVTVEERRVTGFRNLPNVVRIVSAEWTAWLRLTQKGVAAAPGDMTRPVRQVARSTPCPVRASADVRNAHELRERVDDAREPSTRGDHRRPVREGEGANSRSARLLRF